jgi:hypothetical protein
LRKCGIERSTPDHEDAAYLVLSVFQKGAKTAEELKAALAYVMAASERWRP